MKKWIIQIGFIATLGLFASAAMADKIVIYNGHHDGHYSHGRGHYDDRGYRNSGHYNRHRGYRKHARRHERRHYRDHNEYSPYGGRHVYHEAHVSHHYAYAPHYAPRPRYDYGYHSATPVIVGSLIGGVIGAELDYGGPLALGGALLGASIGRDIAYGHGYHH